MKYSVRRTTQFKRDVKHLERRGKNLDHLFEVVKVLAEGQKLAFRYDDHPLKGQYQDKRECHLEPDWLLIYAIEDDNLILYRSGSHADLFR